MFLIIGENFLDGFVPSYDRYFALNRVNEGMIKMQAVD